MLEKEIQCPICKKVIDKSSLSCKDYSVSGEMFNIYVCSDCLLAMTIPQPAPSEIGKYYQTTDYISHSDTSKGIVNKLYHLVRKKNTNDKLKLVNQASSCRADLLDVGCGTGYFLSVCKKDGWHIEGVEVNATARSAAETRTGQSIYPSTDALSMSGKKFDVITLWHVFEHLHDIHASLKQLKQLLKPDGLLILAMPNMTSGDAVYYREHWAGYDVPRHLYHFSPLSVKLLAKQHQLEIRRIAAMKFDAYYVSILSEGIKGKGKISALLHGLIEGYRSNRVAGKTQGRYSSLVYVCAGAASPHNHNQNTPLH